MDSSLPAPENAGFLADRFQAIWRIGGPPPDLFAFLGAYPEATAEERLSVMKVDQRFRWGAGLGLPAERYLRVYPDLAVRTDLLRELARGELEARRDRGETLESRFFLAEFPRLVGPNRDPLDSSGRLTRADTMTSPADTSSTLSPVAPPCDTLPPLTKNGHDRATDYGLSGPLPPPREPERRDKTDSVEALLGSDRFTLHRRLGTGGMGVVYQAFDHGRGEVVALKTMRRVDPLALLRFKDEFRTLADLIHPNLVHLHELIFIDGIWLFTMELIEGIDIIAYVRSAVDPLAEAGPGGSDTGLGSRRGAPLSPGRVERLRHVFRQLAEGVAALHEARRLHRDIKPTNILVTSRGRVVLLDFGLAAELNAFGQFHVSDEPIVGTVAYMAPEQALGGSKLDPASDWYGVGVVLYEALTGRLPFEGTTLDIIGDKQRIDPIPPNMVVTGVPDDLNELCVGLLRRPPEHRPSRHEILSRFTGGPTTVWSSFGQPPSSPFASVPGVPLIGRERHLEVLNGAYASVKEGKPIVMLVSGQSGSGRSRLVQAFLSDVAANDEAVVLAGRCYERESVPYKALDNVIDALSHYLKQLSPRRVRSMLPGDIALLARMFPVLQRVEAVASAPRRPIESPNQQELRRRALDALRELLSRIAERRPLVLAIDDLQWAEPENAALITDLLRPPDPPPLLLLGTYRNEDAEENPFLQALLLSESDGGVPLNRRELNVGALTLVESRELALALLDQDAALSRAQAHLIARESRGNPFFINELVKHVQEGGGLSEPSPTAREVDLDEVLWGRLKPLPEEARRLLEVVVVSGRPISQFDACQAAELGADGRTTVMVLRVARLIRGSGQTHRDEIEIYHDRIRESVIAHLSPEVVARHHLKIGLTLESSGHADPEVLAVHFQGAGRRDRAGYYYAKAADQANELLAFNHAAKLYRLALAHRSGVDPDELRLTMKLGDAFANAGRGAAAAQAYLAAAVLARGPEAIELRHRAAMQLLISGHVDEGLIALNTVLGAMGMTLPNTPRRALVSLLLHRAWLSIRGLGFRCRDVSQITAEDLTRIDVCWSAVAGLSIIDPIRGADFQTRGLLLALRAGEPFRIARALAMEAAHVSSRGEKARNRAARLLKAAEELAEQVGQPQAKGMVKMANGVAAMMCGCWKAARESFGEAETIFRDRCTGVPWELDTVHNLSLWAITHMGDLRELRRRWSILLKEAHQRGDIHAVTTLNTHYMVMIRLADNEPEAAQSELNHVVDRSKHRGFFIQHATALRAQVHIDLYRGEGMKARDLVIRTWPGYVRSHLLRVQMIRIQMLELRARTALAAALEQPKKARSLWRSAERDACRLDREQRPWATASATFIRAGIALAQGQKRKGLEQLVEAEAAFESVDMRLNAMVARRRRGEIVGGAVGVELRDEADRWMDDQRIREPARIARMFAPGYEVSPSTLLDLTHSTAPVTQSVADGV